MKKTVLAILAWSITICVYAQNKIYWVEETPNLTKVKKAGLNGAAPQDVLVSGIKYPNGLDIDPVNGKMYWSEGPGAIRRANLDGSGTETLLLSSGSTGKLKLDIPSGYIYFIDDETQLHRVDLDGANPTQLTTGLDLLTGWDIDPLSEKLYWFDIGTNNLLRANLDGSTQEILISDPTLFVGSLTLDLNQSKIYMTGGNGEILRSNLDGSQSVELIPARGGCPQQLAVDVPNGHLYWTDECSSSIHRADLDGQNALPLITTGLALPGIIRQDATSLYWIDAGTQAIRRANLNGSNVETLLQAEFTAPGGAAYDPVNDKLYLTDAALGIIRRCNPDGSNCEVVIPYGSGLNNPRGIALDIADGKIYWSERHNSPLIRRANLDGSNMEDLVTENDAPLKQVFSIALDPVNGKIYWADLGNGLTDGRIQRADMSGGNVETLFSGDRYAALTLGGDKMYWSIVGANRKLQRANLDGSNPEDLVTTGFGGARGIAIDPVNRKLVWNDLVSDELKRCNLDGSNIETILSGVHTLVPGHRHANQRISMQ